jgi:hypothetical protein
LIDALFIHGQTCFDHLFAQLHVLKFGHLGSSFKNVQDAAITPDQWLRPARTHEIITK